MLNINIENRPLKVQEYQMLRQSTGWNSIEDAVVKKALAQDLFSVCAIHEQQVIGIGRVIGDGAIYFYIQDVIVLPGYQGKGIGRMIMQSIEAYLAQATHRNAFIGLMAAEGVVPFYQQFGYQERPQAAPGMFKRVLI